MPLFGATHPSAAAAASSYVIGNSCRFNGTTSYLHQTFAGAGSTKIMTFSFWIKFCAVTATYSNILHGAGGDDYVRFGTTTRRFEMIGDSGSDSIITTAAYRDPTAWMHFCMTWDTNEAAADDRFKLWVNGVLSDPSDRATDTPPAEDDTFNEFLTAQIHYLGRHNTAIRYLDGYLSQVAMVDGTAYANTDFGEFDSNGNWVPIDITGLTYGTNGSLLDFAIAPGTGFGAGTDVSGSYSLDLIDDTQTYTANNETYGVAANAADGNGATKWWTGNSTTDDWWSVDLGDSNDEAVIRVDFDFGSDHGHVDSVKIYGGTTDDSSGPVSSGATELFDSVTDTITSNTITVSSEFSNTTAYRYYWILFETGGANGTTLLYDVRMYTTGDYGLNHWTESGLAANDQTTDSPTDDADNDIGNYATINPLNSYASATISNGNLEASSGGAWSQIRTTFGMPPGSGKWYWEVDCVSGGYIDLGIINLGAFVGSGANHLAASSSTNGYTEQVTIIQGGNTISIEASPTAYLDGTFAGTETFGFAYDADTGTLWISEDDVWVDGNGSDSSATVKAEIEAGTTSSSAVTGLDGTWFPIATMYGAAVKFQFRPSDITGTIPTGYKPLHTGNLPAPAITDPSAGFNVIDFTGTAAELALTFGGNTALSPDMVQVRDKSDNFDWEMVDTLRGATIEMKWNANAGDATVAQGVKSFDADGVTLGTDAGYNTTSSPNKLIGWKEGPTYGFDMALWTGDGAASQDVAHSLGVTPEFIVACRRDGTEANRAWHKALTGDNYSVLWNDPGYGAEAVASFAATHGTSTFGADGQHNISAETYIAYLWASVEGFSKFGTYIGNASADGAFVHCGFRPRMIFIRRFNGNYGTFLYDTTIDPYNQGTHASAWADDGPEQTSLQLLDIVSNGFKWRQAAGDQNSAAPFMFGAWAEHPFGGVGVSQARAR